MKDKRLDFGIYRNNKITYLDYAATTFMPDRVVESWVDYQQTVGVTYNRGDGPLSESAHKKYMHAKDVILAFFDASDNYDLLFGKNATECLNMLAYSLKNLYGPGDIILMGPYEHHSNILPWCKCAKESGACSVQLPVLESGEINYEFINKLDLNRVKVISISTVSNVNGCELNWDWLEKIQSKCGAFTILDISQAAGHQKLSFEKIHADAFVMSAHKMYGPKNIGAAIVKKEKIDIMPPFLLGGGMVWNSLGENPVWHSGSRKFEAGTFDVGLVVAWASACHYLETIGMEKVRESDKSLWEFVNRRINRDRFVVVPGGGSVSSMISFDIPSMHPHDIAKIASLNKFEIRTGHMCSQMTLNALGFTSLCRISWGIGSDIEDVESFLSLLEGEM